MLDRFLLVGVFASLGTMGLAAPTPPSEEGAPAQAERVRVNCTGTMVGLGQSPPGTPIMTDGMIDFAGRHVQGFGLPAQPIVLLTAGEIDFGSAPPEGARYGSAIRGSIDRQSGKTRIVVRASKEPQEIRIEMRLVCDFEQPAS